MVQLSLSPSITQLILLPLPIQSRAVTRIQHPNNINVVNLEMNVHKIIYKKFTFHIENSLGTACIHNKNSVKLLSQEQ